MYCFIFSRPKNYAKLNLDEKWLGLDCILNHVFLFHCCTLQPVDKYKVKFSLT